jgi:hypothetical protein
MKKRILFLAGSLNQTSQMYEIFKQLERDYDCWFSQLFVEGKLENWCLDNGFLDATVLAGAFRAQSEKYMRDKNLQIDYRAEKYNYDLVFFPTDLLIPESLRQTKSIFIQEGMIDRPTLITKVVDKLKFPVWLSTNTALNGSRNLLDVYCTASEGYRNYLAKMGTNIEKIFVTGMPNFDNVKEFLTNDFPHKNYIMVATTDMRETLKIDNRPAFLKKCVKIANGRQLLFKMHPNEKRERFEKEIRKYTPADSLIFFEGNTNHMIANCDELITQFSTVVYVGLILGKKVHSYFNLEMLKRLQPIQNNGTSAVKIAEIAKAFIEFDGEKEDFVKNYNVQGQLKQLEYATF